jgi:hypothetical protein
MIKTEFRQTWLHGVSRQSASGTAKLAGFDVIVAASSWDKRCLCITNEHQVRAKFAIMLLFSMRDNQGLRDHHDPALEIYLRSVADSFESLLGSSTAVEGMWATLKDKLISIASALGRPISILLDISTLPRACLFIAQWRDLGDGAVMKLHPDYESVVPMLARFVKATDT